MKEYVTADLHFCHPRIIEFERTQFKNIAEHNEKIVWGLNSVLKPDDVLWVLGDVGFRVDGSLKPISDLVHRIECGRKILVMGNHDHFSEIEARGMGFDEVYKGPVYYPSSVAPGRIILSHRPVREAYDNPYAINVHGHIHSGVIDLPNYFNVNIHMTRYIPQSLSRFEDIAVRTLKNRNEQFPSEWYSDFEVRRK